MRRRSRQRSWKVQRGKRRLTVPLILSWADAYYAKHGAWPKMDTGPVEGEIEETWRRVDNALVYGLRGFRYGGSSLAQLLAKHRGVRNVRRLLPLTEALIARWAEHHYRRTGQWPNENSGPIHGQPGETWYNVNAALRGGDRRLPGGTTLAKLLAERFGIRNRANVPPLTEAQILAWADAHKAQTRRWPKKNSGPVLGTEETWVAIDSALRLGTRDLPGGSSLARLLQERRGVRNKSDLPRLTERQIVAWAKAHRERTGRWPSARSGPVVDAPGENWPAVNLALWQGLRGLPGGSSLSRLLKPLRGERTRHSPERK